MIEQLKKLWNDATPAEREFAKGLAVGAGMIVSFLILGHTGWITPDPANRDPWLGDPPGQN